MRGQLIEKFTTYKVGKFIKEYKERYKKETGETYKGNVIYDITLGILEKKRIPEIEDCITLIKLGSFGTDGKDITDERAYERYDTYVEKEKDNGVGVVSIFCGLCKCLCEDIPIHEKFNEAINDMENQIINTIDAKNKIKELTAQLNGLFSNLNNTNEQSKTTDAETVEE